MSLEFTLNTAGALNVRGFGQSKYGHFDIRGTCSADVQDLALYCMSFDSIVVVTCFCSQLPGVLDQASAAVEGVGAGGAWCADVAQAVGQGPVSRAGGAAVDAGPGPQAWRICFQCCCGGTRPQEGQERVVVFFFSRSGAAAAAACGGELDVEAGVGAAAEGAIAVADVAGAEDVGCGVAVAGAAA